jgi:hypothetical protein
VARWASPSGVPFLGDDRASTGVKPSVEVKRPDTPEPVEVENLIDQQDSPSPQPTPSPKPTPAPAAEDLQLKRAIELLTAVPAARAAPAR